MTEPTDDELRKIAREATGTGYYSGGVKALRAVWEAAEKAHTPSAPTDHEVHALGDLIEHVQTRWEATRDGFGSPLADFTAQAIIDAGFRRPQGVQGEPSDAIVEAALFAYNRSLSSPVYTEADEAGMRAALRAAGGVR